MNIDKKYILSSDFTILDIKDIEKFITKNVGMVAVHDKVLRGELFILENNRSRRRYFIPPIVKAFLDGFREPISLKGVIESFAKEVGCHPREIVDQMYDFFEDMRYRNVLVGEKKAMKIKTRSDERITFKVGHLVDEYEIMGTISKKTSVVIYKAKGVNTGKEVALKVLRPDPTLSPKKKKFKRQQFKQEYQFLEELKADNNICRLIAYKETDALAYAVLELIEGLNLKVLLKKVQPNLVKRLQIIDQLFDVIAFLHSNEVIHGDLHSKNFLIKEDFTVKLIDFDLANHKHPLENEILRRGGVFHYIPPERVNNSAFSSTRKRAGYKSEVFQLAVVAYLALYGSMPFTGKTWHELASAIKNNDPEFSPTTNNGEEVPAFLIEILKKALQKKPKQRFKNAVLLNEAWQSEYKNWKERQKSKGSITVFNNEKQNDQRQSA